VQHGATQLEVFSAQSPIDLPYLSPALHGVGGALSGPCSFAVGVPDDGRLRLLGVPESGLTAAQRGVASPATKKQMSLPAMLARAPASSSRRKLD
jgi:hypothetical protein